MKIIMLILFCSFVSYGQPFLTLFGDDATDVAQDAYDTYAARVTAGYIRAYAYKNGVSTNQHATVDINNPNYFYRNIVRGAIEVEAGDYLEIRLFTSGLSPTTLDITSGIKLEH